ncbi:UrcA family protein [Aurantiacibacter sp. D1-12]|uniref:UrcA family protein n=1 Tax=Aurantiacibacter sp. D1-12 TaxID=2993658 RepID=UPI00237D223C|nr:UrcA family protein [Aurantiacibacter sp. D1-12]MDE1468106.1 UrcA family protein [Aurantiacibacter sp. D1-12]
MKRLSALALAVATSGIVLSPAIAEAQDQGRTTSVSYADLDLSTDEGVETLNFRIERAARQICGFNEHETGTRIRSQETRQCVTEARERVEDNLVVVFGE